jgi:hypothetical protein
MVMTLTFQNCQQLLLLLLLLLLLPLLKSSCPRQEKWKGCARTRCARWTFSKVSFLIDLVCGLSSLATHYVVKLPLLLLLTMALTFENFWQKQFLFTLQDRQRMLEKGVCVRGCLCVSVCVCALDEDLTQTIEH